MGIGSCGLRGEVAERDQTYLWSPLWSNFSGELSESMMRVAVRGEALRMNCFTFPLTAVGTRRWAACVKSIALLQWPCGRPTTTLAAVHGFIEGAKWQKRTAADCLIHRRHEFKQELVYANLNQSKFPAEPPPAKVR